MLLAISGWRSDIVAEMEEGTINLSGPPSICPLLPSPTKKSAQMQRTYIYIYIYMPTPCSHTADGFHVCDVSLSASGKAVFLDRRHSKSRPPWLPWLNRGCNAFLPGLFLNTLVVKEKASELLVHLFPLMVASLCFVIRYASHIYGSHSNICCGCNVMHLCDCVPGGGDKKDALKAVVLQCKS